MDFTLLYAAKSAARNPAPVWRTALSAALGGVFAVVFPLVALPSWASVAVKIISGVILCLAAGKFGSFKAFLAFVGIFFALCALLGGMLIGIFALTGMEYGQGSGYVLSSVPVGIPLFGGLLVIIFAKKLAQRLKKTAKTQVDCKIYAGESEVGIKGFFDSGNKVYKSGVPVSVIPASAAEKLIGSTRISGGVKIHTVAGSKIMKVFTADRIEINFGDRTVVKKGVLLGVSPAHISLAVLHPDLSEE